MARKEYAQSVLGLAESLERIPSYPMLADINPDKDNETLTTAGASAVYAGEEVTDTSRTLICDDLFLENFAREIGVETVNTQALLAELLRSNLVTNGEFSPKVEQLVLMNYWFVHIRAKDILQRLKENNYQATDGIVAMLRTLQGPDCSEDTAAAVGAEVVASLAIEPMMQQQRGSILSLVIADLRRGRTTDQVLVKMKREIGHRLRLAPLQRDEIIQTVNLYMQM